MFALIMQSSSSAPATAPLVPKKNAEKANVLEEKKKNPLGNKEVVKAWELSKPQRFDPTKKTASKLELSADDAETRNRAAAAAVAALNKIKQQAEEEASLEAAAEALVLEKIKADDNYANLDSLKNIFHQEVTHVLSFCPVLSCPVLSCPVLSCPVLSCLVLSCPALSCPLLSCPFSSYPSLSSTPVGSCLVQFFSVTSSTTLSCPLSSTLSPSFLLFFCHFLTLPTSNLVLYPLLLTQFTHYFILSYHLITPSLLSSSSHTHSLSLRVVCGGVMTALLTMQ
jgi:hypothetical protein